MVVPILLALLMVVLGCLGILKKKNDSVKKTTKEDEHGIIGYNLGYKNQLISMIDVKSTRVSKVSGLKALRGDKIKMGNSCNGLIMLISCSARYCVIFNPKSNKIVKRITPPAWLDGDTVGFFYHPLAKEYRTLDVVRVGNDRYEYHIYLFGSDTWRTALNPFFHFTPFEESEQRPACTKQALYWYCETDGKIVVFDIIGEEFCMKPSPVCGKEKDLYNPPTLVAKNNEESLCCCYVHRAELSIDVWVLEDYANWSWNRKYVVDVNWCTDRYPSEAWRAYATCVTWNVKVASIQKDELVFYYKGNDAISSICSYHLESGFSAKTLLSETDWKRKDDCRTKEWYSSMFCGFIGF